MLKIKIKGNKMLARLDGLFIFVVVGRVQGQLDNCNLNSVLCLIQENQ